MFGSRSQGAALQRVEVGVLYAFINYIARVVEPLIQITMQFSLLQQAMVAAARVQRAAEGSRGAAGGRTAAQRDRGAHRDRATSTSATMPASRCCTT